ncbi:hypothetical protein DIPPA_08954 [Diplonema papillatum]|nr:hypothetical protein DIPPA_08954 [Diplonema papillatum]
MNLPTGTPLPDWKPKNRPPLSPMVGRYCSVVPLAIEEHEESLYRALAQNTDGTNWTYLPYGPFDGADDFRAWLVATCTGPDPLFHTVLNSADGSAIGLASFLRIEPTVGVVEVGHIHISPAVQQTPISTEAMYLMMRRVFDELGYRRYEWRCDSLNAPSKAAALRLGFTLEAVFRQATVYKARNRDTLWFSIIDSEWPLLRDAFERWLHPDNFDANGAQVRRLTDLR